MLTLSKLDAHSVAYYESTVIEAREQVGADTTDYYSEHSQVLPRVFIHEGPAAEKGSTGASLGVADGAILEANEVERWLVGGVTPDGTARLGRQFGESSVRGFDLTFSSPKSVSIIGEVTGDHETRAAIAEAHRAGVAAGLAYLAQHATYTQQRPAPGAAPEIFRVQALSGVSYEHHTARPVVDADGVEHVDPHTHTHVLLSNRQLDERGKFVSLDGTSIYHELRAAGMVAAAVERQAITQSLGIEFQAVDPKTGLSDVVGFTPELIEKFSHRRNQIQQWADEHGHELTAAATEVAQKRTREIKNTDLAPEEQREHWRELAAHDGVPSVEEVQAISARYRRELGELATAEKPPSSAAILLHATQDKSTFTRADLVESAAALMPSAIPGQYDPRVEIERAADRALAQAITLEAPSWQGVEREGAGGVQAAGQREGALRFSTAEVLAHEVNATWIATEYERSVASSAAGIADAGSTFSEAQREAMVHLVESEARVTVVTAAAGAGKTSSLKTAAECWHGDERGYRRIIGLAPTGKAADVLAHEGFTDDAMTVDRALAQLNSGESPFGERDVVVVDEAAMTSDQHLVRLIEAADRVDAKLVLVGDDEQLQAVNGRRGMFSWLAENGDGVQLDEVFRQRNAAERAATLGLRAGTQDALDASLDWYEGVGRLSTGSADAMLDDAWMAWKADTDEGKNSLLVAPTWQAAAALNQRTQRERIEAGEVDPERARSARLSAGEQAFEGDVILTRRNDYKLTDSNGNPLRNGHRWEIALIHDGHDVVRLRRADDPSTTIEVPSSYLSSHARLGWASTIHAAQGATYDTAHAVLSEETSTRELAYVALTRGREENKAYIIASEPDEGLPGHDHDDEPAELPDYRGSSEEAREALAQIAARDPRHETALAYATRLEGDHRHGHTLTPEMIEQQLGEAVAAQLGTIQAEREHAKAIARKREQEQPIAPEPAPMTAAQQRAARMQARVDQREAHQQHRDRNPGHGLEM